MCFYKIYWSYIILYHLQTPANCFAFWDFFLPFRTIFPFVEFVSLWDIFSKKTVFRVFSKLLYRLKNILTFIVLYSSLSLRSTPIHPTSNAHMRSGKQKKYNSILENQKALSSNGHNFRPSHRI